MNIFNCLNKKSWLLMGLCASLAAIVQAGTTYDTGTGSQGATGTSPGTSGTSPGTSGTSPGTSGSSSGTSGTSPGTSGTWQGRSKIQPFQTMDKNSDSYVTKNELIDSPALAKLFDRADANKDGQLEENEYKNLIMENAQ
jgi:hypothetical protein